MKKENMHGVRLRNQEGLGPATMDEILAPIRKQFMESGMTEEDLDVLLDEAREEVWEEKHAQESRN